MVFMGRTRIPKTQASSLYLQIHYPLVKYQIIDNKNYLYAKNNFDGKKISLSLIEGKSDDSFELLDVLE